MSRVNATWGEWIPWATFNGGGQTRRRAVGISIGSRTWVLSFTTTRNEWSR